MAKELPRPDVYALPVDDYKTGRATKLEPMIPFDDGEIREFQISECRCKIQKNKAGAFQTEYFGGMLLPFGFEVVSALPSCLEK
jgi:hypothetical protein